jgi:hypothetical protein
MENGELIMDNVLLRAESVGITHQLPCGRSFPRSPCECSLLSFPRSAWECSLGRSCGPNLCATLERRHLLPRWSVGARKKLVRSLLTNCTSLAFPRHHVGARKLSEPSRVRCADHSSVGFTRGSLHTADPTWLIPLCASASLRESLQEYLTQRRRGAERSGKNARGSPRRGHAERPSGPLTRRLPTCTPIDATPSHLFGCLSRSHAPRGNAALAAPAARTHTRRWSVGTCSHAGAWEPETWN